MRDILRRLNGLVDMGQKYRTRDDSYWIKESNYNYNLLKNILENPENPTRDRLDAKEYRFQMQRPYSVVYQLERGRLNDTDTRMAWVNKIKNIAILVEKFLDEKYSDLKEIHEKIVENLRRSNNEDRKLRFPFESMAILVAFCENSSNNFPLKEKIRDLVMKMKFIQSRIFLGKLIFIVADNFGIVSKESIDDEIAEAREEIDNVLISTGEAVGDDAKRMREMERHIEELRISFEYAEQQMDQLREKIDEIRTEALKEAIVTFFQTMNSTQFGNLLDQFAISEKTLKDLKKEGFEVPSRIESVPASIRMFMQFVRSKGLQTAETIGARKKINLAESDNYEYLGTDFVNEEELKEVEIIAPGWNYMDKIISKARAKEILCIDSAQQPSDN